MKNYMYRLAFRIVFCTYFLTISIHNFCQVCIDCKAPSNFQTNLIAYYPFCGNANDESGNKNDGKVSGATLTADRFGRPNNAYKFSGNNQFISIDKSTTLQIQKNITISLYVLMDGGSCNPRFIEFSSPVTMCGGFTVFSWGTSNTSRSIRGSFNNCTEGLEYMTDSLLPSLKWNHIVYTCDSNAVGKFYFNGRLVQTQTGVKFSKPIDYSTHDKMVIGNINPGRCDWFGGSIDDIMIWNRVLSGTEVQNLSNLIPSSTFTYNPLPDTIKACSQSRLLDAGPGYLSYKWNNGITSQTLLANSTGWYKVTVTNATGCTATDSTYLIIESPLQNQRYPTLSTTPNFNLSLSARNIPNSSYQWIPPSGISSSTIQNPVFNSTSSQEYIIKITTRAGCIAYDTLKVVVFKESNILVPKAFSPNGDGQNDKIYPFLVGINRLVYFRIYNRWGNLVFETTDPAIQWDGYYKGKLQPYDTYTWLAEAIDISNNKIQRSGNFIILR